MLHPACYPRSLLAFTARMPKGRDKPSRPRKKRKTESDEDIEAAEHDTSSGLTPSIRYLLPDSVPTLGVITIRVFASNFRKLWKNQRYRTEKQLRILPDTLIPKIFAALSASCSGVLTSNFIAEVCNIAAGRLDGVMLIANANAALPQRLYRNFNGPTARGQRVYYCKPRLWTHDKYHSPATGA